MIACCPEQERYHASLLTLALEAEDLVAMATALRSTKEQREYRARALCKAVSDYQQARNAWIGIPKEQARLMVEAVTAVAS